MTQHHEQAEMMQIWKVNSADTADMPDRASPARTGAPARPGRPSRLRPVGALDAFTRVPVTAGLAIDAYVHADLADTYTEAGGTINEGVLLRTETVVASLAALAVLITGRRLEYLVAFAVGGSALAVILVARYATSLGPFDYLLDPVWYPEKLTAAFAEGITCAIAAASALSGVLPHRRPARDARPRAHPFA